MTRATAFAPATVANVAVGFDLLGFALDSPGDRVTARIVDGREPVTLTRGTGDIEVPLDPAANTAAVAARSLLEAQGRPFSVDLTLDKGIPLSSGLGGSAASAVGAVVAVNALLESPLPQDRLLPHALAGEAVASGAPHADNAAPCLFGGLVAALPGSPPRVVSIPVPSRLIAVIAHPAATIDTRAARNVLSAQVPLPLLVQQSGRLAGVLAGLYSGDLGLIGENLVDVVIEGQRKARVPGFDPVQRAARRAGALGCSLSGSGPSLFAWADGPERAAAVAGAMRDTYAREEIPVTVWTSPVGAPGARVLPSGDRA